MTHIDDVETPDYQLEIYECNCGFHIGFDCTYLDQVGGINIGCPSCGTMLIIDAFEEEVA
jgi:predicted RNA-binding Zn-ribbon protein involved in translation (DUF1610 family)